MSKGKPKPRIAKDYDKMPEDLITRIKMEYPNGFENNLISYTDAKGNKVSALPFETEEAYYLVRMTLSEAKRIIEEDEDYDEGGNLREDFGVEEVEGEAEDDGGSDDEDDSYGDEPADDDGGDDEE